MKHSLRFIFGSVLFCVFILCLSSFAIAKPNSGITVSYVLASKEPVKLHGYQMMVHYDPDRFKWHELDVYFDGGYSRFTTPRSYHYSTINIYAIAPIVRFSFKRHGLFSGFLEFSVGLSYLDRTRLEKRKLGIHFAFQDRMGIGCFLGRSQQLSLGIHAVHYSNAHLSSHNSGMSIPLLLDIGYRF